MNRVFLDTVGMIAAWDDTDQWHAAAHAAYRASCPRYPRTAGSINLQPRPVVPKTAAPTPCPL
ncbi:MAG: hypothetical protein ABSG53_25625 [Thermoguttaceae bacterium]